MILIGKRVSLYCRRWLVQSQLVRILVSTNQVLGVLVRFGFVCLVGLFFEGGPGQSCSLYFHQLKHSWLVQMSLSKKKYTG